MICTVNSDFVTKSSIRGFPGKVNKTENLFDCFLRDGLKCSGVYGMMIVVGLAPAVRNKIWRNCCDRICERAAG